MSDSAFFGVTQWGRIVKQDEDGNIVPIAGAGVGGGHLKNSNNGKAIMWDPDRTRGKAIMWDRNQKGKEQEEEDQRMQEIADMIETRVPLQIDKPLNNFEMKRMPRTSPYNGFRSVLEFNLNGLSVVIKTHGKEQVTIDVRDEATENCRVVWKRGFKNFESFFNQLTNQITCCLYVMNKS